MKRLRNFLTSFLISVVVFCMPAYAEFTSVDSNNLSSIQIYVRSIDSGISNVITSITNLSSYFNTLISSVGSLSNSLSSYFNSYQSWYTDISGKFDDLLSVYGLSSFSSKYLGNDALIYFNDTYFNKVSVSSGSSASFNDDGYIVLSNVSVFSIYGMIDTNRTISYSFPSGIYFISLSYPGSFDSSLSISFYGPSTDSYSVELVSNNSSGYNSNVCVYKLVVNHTFSSSSISFSFSSSKTGILYGGISKASDDFIAGDAINPDQDGMVSDVDDAGQQQSQQEDEMWQNINTYKGDISFNLDGWDDAAGGLSYVTGVFMTIWNNSPTQPIVLSLMLGIAMLSIGRGVMAAVRVSRNRGDD